MMKDAPGNRLLKWEIAGALFLAAITIAAWVLPLPKEFDHALAIVGVLSLLLLVAVADLKLFLAGEREQLTACFKIR